MKGLVILFILLWLAKSKSGGCSGYREVTPSPPPNPKPSKKWGTPVPNWKGYK